MHWRGNVASSVDPRSIPLGEFASLALAGVTLFSLQKNVGLEELRLSADRFGIVQVGDFDTSSGPFMDTAALMLNLDLVVTCDTAIAHLAGGLGVPVWVALPRGAEWRWFEERDDSPWYPSMRLFRQRRAGQWSEVFERMASELGSLARPS